MTRTRTRQPRPSITPELAARIMRDHPVMRGPFIQVTTYGQPNEDFWKIVDTYKPGLTRMKIERMIFHKGYLLDEELSISFGTPKSP